MAKRRLHDHPCPSVGLFGHALLQRAPQSFWAKTADFADSFDFTGADADNSKHLRVEKARAHVLEARTRSHPDAATFAARTL